MPDLASWLAEARQHLEAARGGPAVGAVRVLVRDEGGACVSWTLPAEVEPASGCVAALSQDEQAIVAAILAAGNEPMVAKRIAARAKLPYGTRLRILLANLAERNPPVLAVSGEGYMVVGQRKPEP